MTFSAWKATDPEPVPNGHWVSKVLAVGAFGSGRRKRKVETGDQMDTGAIAVSVGQPAIISPEAAMERALAGLEAGRLDETR